jgi:predicted ester cyclase
MSRERDNKAFVGRWFPPPTCCSSIRCMRRAVAREDVRNFMEGFRAAFPDLNFWGAAELIAEGDYVVGRWEGGGTHTGPALSDFFIGSLPTASGRKMRFTGTTVLRVENGKIAEEVGLDDGVTALQQLGLLKAA